MFIFKLTGVYRRFRYAVKTESETSPRLENMLFNFHIANVFKHLKGLKMDCHIIDSLSLAGETKLAGLL